MANIQSAKKRARQSIKRRAHNMSLRSRLRTSIKRVQNAIKENDKDAALAAFKAAVPEIDSMANKGIIHANKAARHKQRLNRDVKAL